MKLQFFPKIVAFPASTKKWRVLGIIGLLTLALTLSLPPAPAEAQDVNDASLQCSFAGNFSSSTVYEAGAGFSMDIDFANDATLVASTETANYSYGLITGSVVVNSVAVGEQTFDGGGSIAQILIEVESTDTYSRFAFTAVLAGSNTQFGVDIVNSPNSMLSSTDVRDVDFSLSNLTGSLSADAFLVSATAQSFGTATSGGCGPMLGSPQDDSDDDDGDDSDDGDDDGDDDSDDSDDDGDDGDDS